MEELLKKHEVFSSFQIVNVAGNGDEEIDPNDALNEVQSRITEHPENTYTITLTCGRLTTGVSVPAWTCCLMLSGGYQTSAAQYMQTIFRVQTPASIAGKTKENCYVFDFAPDRTLKMIVDSITFLHKNKSTNEHRELITKFLNYCPVISSDKSSMREYDTNKLMQELKKVYVERVYQSGFQDIKLYDEAMLKEISNDDWKNIDELSKIVGASKNKKNINQVELNKLGFDNPEFDNNKKIDQRNKLGDEEKEEITRKNKLISTLRAVSIRIPLLVYGINIKGDQQITVDNFPELMTDTEGNDPNASWNEFMPKGVTKDKFREIKKFYNQDIFTASCKKIINTVRNADNLDPIERVREITNLFSTFRNPDKETVLTPWRVVNMHLSDTIGGSDFYDERHKQLLVEPRFVKIEKVTDEVFSESSKLLEINSKTGLYPLYLTFSLYKIKLEREHLNKDEISLEEKIKIWDSVVANNIFIICKTPMAKLITKRTLLGFRRGKVNMHFFEDLIKQLRLKKDNFINKVKEPSYWSLGGKENMNFNVVVGNPPYQELVAKNNGSVSQANPVYNLFVEAAIKLSTNYVSMITPSLWMTAGTGLDSFRKYMLDQNHISILHDYEKSEKLFPTVNIAGGVSYFLWDKKTKGETKSYYHKDDGTEICQIVNMNTNGDNIFIRDATSKSIINKVGSLEHNFNSFMQLVSTYSPFSNGVVGNYKGLFINTPSNDTVKIYRNPISKKEKFEYIKREHIIARQDWIDKHKVFVSKAGEISAKFNGLPFYGEPGSVCTETYLVVGPFDSKQICINVIKYMNTSLYRFLISQIKKTQNAARGVYKYVPIFDFETTNDIDWNKSIEEIDKDIFKKFNLTIDEIDYVLKTVKAK
uniref:Eco57I restriction-modification methylase domain-containing protein n=2 Tax=Mycoplasma feriruminatoris TaxID=1179777 RepID=UPI0018A86B40|nr:Eco57I restriction-modification methylase domain-containing protein [Mycoplasma feriruminatoris]